jgi:hypothetical protein
MTALVLLGCEDSSETDRWSGKSVSAADPAEPSPPPAPAPTETAAPTSPEASAPMSINGVLFQGLPTALGVVLCDKIFECCGPSEAMSLILGEQLTRENCPYLAPYYFGDYFERRTLSVVEDRVAYHAERVPACVDRLSARSCEEFGAALTTSRSFPRDHLSFGPEVFSCDDLLSADQKPGQLCQNDYECIDGACVSTIGSDRRCQAYVNEGGACNDYSVFCSPALACLQGICRKPGKLGETCFDRPSLRGCEPGLYCSDQGTCQSRLADGEICNPFGDGSFSCLSGSCPYEYDPVTGTYTGHCSPSFPSSGPPAACTGK